MEKGPLDSKKSVSLLLSGLHDILAYSSDYVFVKDTSFVYYGGSKAFCALAGLHEEKELLGKTDYDLFSKEIADKYRKDDEDLLASQKPIIAMVERIPSENGKERFSETTKRLIYGENGEILGLYGISHDVTEVTSLREEAVAAKRSVDLVSKLPGGIGILHRAGQGFVLDFANDGYFLLHGIPLSEADSYLGKAVTSFIDPEDLQGIISEYERVEKDDRATGMAVYRLLDLPGLFHWIKILFRYAYSEKGTRYYYTSYFSIDEQKKVEADLLGSQATLKEALSNSDFQYFTYFPEDHKAVLYVVNKRYSGSPSLYTNFPSSFISYGKLSEEDAKGYLEMVRKIDQGSKEASCSFKMFFKGAYYDCNVHMDLVEGDPPRALCYIVDITSRVRSEEKIRRERVRLKSLEGSVFEAFSFNLSKNSQPDIETSDVEMLSSPLDEKLRQEAYDLCPALANSNPATVEVLLRAASRIPAKEDRARFILTCAGSQIRKGLSQGIYSNEVMYRRLVKGNCLHYVSSQMEVLPDPETGDLYAFFYTKDINEDVVNEKITSKIIHRNYESVATLDLRNDVFHFLRGVDPLIQSVDNLPYEEALQKVLEWIPEEERTDFIANFDKGKILQALEKQSVYSLYNARKENLGDPKEAVRREMANDIFYLDENKDVLVFLLSDVTAIFEKEKENRDKLKSALIAAEQASLAKTEFLSRMSHEIRTPMNAIIGLDAIALQEKDLSSSMEDHLQKIGISAHFLLSLINDILDMSRIESGRMVLKNELFDFEELINGINTILYQQCKDSGLDYECVLKTYTEDRYIGDSTKLQQVLVNVLGNAVKFTPRGGKIHFLISQTAVNKNQALMKFEVTDTGIGIDEAFIPHLFEPFSQENRGRTSIYGGTGLGLAISKNIVNLMGGEIAVHSIKNIGSSFTITIPLELSEESLSRKKWYNPKMNRLLTLIVDDDVIVCQHTKITLSEAGFECDYVTSGLDAIEKVTKQRQLQKDFDLILLDWKMPDLDGIETARRIRQVVGKEVTIIVMTAYDWADIESEALAAGVDYFVRKPIFASSIEKAFENVFARKMKDGTLPPLKEVVPTYDFKGAQILLAEDNEINAEIATSLLKNKNAKVSLAKNGAEAVEQFASSPVGHFKAILMDVRMPIMDGLEASKTIRAMKKKDALTIPIIAMTANAFQEDVNQSLEAGMNAHLAKPIEPEVLYSTLEKFLEKKEDK